MRKIAKHKTIPTEPEAVAFPDENLEANIREHLGKAPGEEITVTELATLTIFMTNDRGIADLPGIQNCSSGYSPGSTLKKS